MTPKKNAFAILDDFIQIMLKTKLANRNFYTVQTKAAKKARAGLMEWGYSARFADQLISDAREMVVVLRGKMEELTNEDKK